MCFITKEAQSSRHFSLRLLCDLENNMLTHTGLHGRGGRFFFENPVGNGVPVGFPWDGSRFHCSPCDRDEAREKKKKVARIGRDGDPNNNRSAFIYKSKSNMSQCYLTRLGNGIGWDHSSRTGRDKNFSFFIIPAWDWDGGIFLGTAIIGELLWYNRNKKLFILRYRKTNRLLVEMGRKNATDDHLFRTAHATDTK